MNKEENELLHELELWFQREAFRKKLKEISERLNNSSKISAGEQD